VSFDIDQLLRFMFKIIYNLLFLKKKLINLNLTNLKNLCYENVIDSVSIIQTQYSILNIDPCVIVLQFTVCTRKIYFLIKYWNLIQYSKVNTIEKIELQSIVLYLYFIVYYLEIFDVLVNVTSLL